MKCCKDAAFVCVSIILLCNSCNLVSSGTNSAPITGILGAFPKEVVMLEEQITEKKEQTIEGKRFVVGRLSGRRVALTWTGIGKVNAAMTTTLMIEHFKPNEVIFTGIAGGINPDLLPGDIVIAERVAHHDLGVVTPSGFEARGVINPLTGRRNPVFFPANERLLKLAELTAKEVELEPLKTSIGERVPRIIKGVVVTGDAFIASSAKGIELREKLGADAVEKEGAAVAQICYQRGIPYLVIRSISDKADEKAREDLEKFLKMAAENSARLVARIAEHLDSELFIEKGRGRQ